MSKEGKTYENHLGGVEFGCDPRDVTNLEYSKTDEKFQEQKWIFFSLISISLLFCLFNKINIVRKMVLKLNLITEN